MPNSKTLQLNEDQWRQLQHAARDGRTDGVAGILTDHLDAPITSEFVTTAGGRGARTRLTMIGGQAVLVTQRIALADGETHIEPGAQVTFTGPNGLWPAVARTLPDTPLLRTSGIAAAAEDRTLDLTAESARQLLEREACNLHVRVEARTGNTDPEPGNATGTPLVVWGRLWSVVDDRLIDVRTHDGTLRLVERPAGSVEKELRWAWTGALDASASRGGVTR